MDQLLEKPYVEPEQRMGEEDLGMDSKENGDADQVQDSRPGSPGPDAEEEEPKSLVIEKGATQTQ